MKKLRALSLTALFITVIIMIIHLVIELPDLVIRINGVIMFICIILASYSTTKTLMK